MSLRVSLLVPTYRRPKDLARCLEALNKQTRLPDEVLVVVRDTDLETWTLLESIDLSPLALRRVKVTEPGVVAAMNAGLKAAGGQIIALTNDDATPYPDWLERIEGHFRADYGLGSVGGRDWVYHRGRLEEETRTVVGKVQWFGRVIGNHHLGVGGPREVDVLKGVNCAYRAEPLRRIGFDARLWGGGLMGWELSLSLQLRQAGWKLIYDPAVAVNHYLGQRFGEDQRTFAFNAQALTDEVHNETLVLLEHLPSLRRTVFIFWAVLLGTRSARGLVQWLRFLPKEGRLSGAKLRAALSGRIEGWRTWRRSGD